MSFIYSLKYYKHLNSKEILKALFFMIISVNNRLLRYVNSPQYVTFNTDAGMSLGTEADFHLNFDI